MSRVSTLNAYEEEREVEIRQRSPCEEQLHRIVDEFDLDGHPNISHKTIQSDGHTDLEKEHPENVLTGRPDTPEEYCGMDGGEERAVEPPTTLRDELRHLWEPEVSAKIQARSLGRCHSQLWERRWQLSHS